MTILYIVLLALYMIGVRGFYKHFMNDVDFQYTMALEARPSAIKCGVALGAIFWVLIVVVQPIVRGLHK